MFASFVMLIIFTVVFTTVAEDEPTYDDIFEPTEEIEDIGMTEVDDFFKDSEFGTVYDWDAQADEEPTTEFYVPTDSTTDSTKSTKLGKAMWEEVPVMAKGAKSGKSYKSSKSSAVVKKGAKGAFLGLPTPQTYEAVVEDAVVEEETTDSWLSAFEAEGGLTYADLFNAEAEEEETEIEETEVMGGMGGRKFYQSLISEESVNLSFQCYSNDLFFPPLSIFDVPRYGHL